jgi:hypothetical protein
MNLDVDAWALDCREKIARIYRTRGEVIAGAFVLATIDPTTGEELPTPQTWTQYFHDYTSLGEFETALRIQCERTRALGTVVFTAALRLALGLPVYPVLCFTYERRGRARPTKWTARMGPGKTELGEFHDSSLVPQRHGLAAVLPPVN